MRSESEIRAEFKAQGFRILRNTFWLRFSPAPCSLDSVHFFPIQATSPADSRWDFAANALSIACTSACPLGGAFSPAHGASPR
jgi:hypothetical protein